MKILVLGATGRTGKRVVEEALQRGHTVSAIARDPDKLKGYIVEITEGTPYDYDTVVKAITGCHAVINTLNVSRRSDNPWAKLAAPADMISKAAANALAAMEKEGITRFVALSTMGAGRSWKKTPWLLRFIVTISNLRFAFEDHGRQEQLLENSPMDYTICRAPMLSDKINNSGAVSTAENKRPPTAVLSRNSAAAFFIQIIENNQHFREIINLSNKPS